MRDLKTVIAFTIKDMAKRKSFIISTFIILVLIVIGINIPNIMKAITGDNENAGERRRVWASCQVDGYSDIAGGISFRKDQGERMRFKVLHKIQNYKNRFGYPMCVGCGRCENVCPEYISYIECLNKLSAIGGNSHE